MKNVKKLLALVLAVAICAAFALPALAADDDGYTLTMTNPEPGHTYTLYQIFKGTVGVNATVLSDIEWGESFINTPGEDAAGIAESLTTAAAMEKYLADLNVENLKGYREPQTATSESSLTWDELPGGYYMVVDSTTDGAVPASRIMAKIVGDATITTKPDKPVLEKKVAKMNAEGTQPEWKDAIDAAFAETYQFELLVSINKENVARFVARPPLDENGQPIKDDAGNPKYEYPIKLSDSWDKMEIVSENPVVKLVEITTDAEGKEVVTEKYSVSQFDYALGTDNKSFTLTVDLLKTLGTIPDIWDVPANFYVQVVYQAKLTPDAVIYPTGNNINHAHLDYKNDPEQELPDTQGNDDEAYVYTFKIEGVKVDGDEATKTLDGAIFNLYTEEEYNNGTPLNFTKDDKGNYKLSDAGDPEVTSADGTGKFNFVGLSVGTYVLVETKAPDGYNKMTDVIVVKIEEGAEDETTKLPTYSQSASVKDGKDDDKTLTTGGSNEQPEYTIGNFKGSLLPSTGGIGTTIFYVVGAVLVVGAGVLLFAKRRARS